MSLPFFETLKDITKENKDDYRWTERVENAFQELKKMILDLPALTTPLPKETLFIYLASSGEAVNAMLLVVRKGKQYPVHYVSRTLHDAEQNYAMLEKLALALRHVSRRLRSVQYYVRTPQRYQGTNISGLHKQGAGGQRSMVLRCTPYIVDHQKDCREEWVLYTDGAFSVKGSGAGIVLISPTKT
ncbi:reverse transcriptase domain-containing protein [Tanacetum coccineum]